MSSEETYTVEVTGEQAALLASLLAAFVQARGELGEWSDEEIEAVARVGEQCTDIAAEAGEWEE